MDKAITLVFVAAVACMDLDPLRVYRYLLLSDVLLLVALALHVRTRWNGRVYFPKFLAVVFVLYLLSTGIAFIRPLAPENGVFTWLHSAFLMLVYVPAVTTLLVARPTLRRYAFVTLLVSVTLQAFIVARAVSTGLHWQTGLRISGAFGSAQLSPYAVAAVAAVAVLRSGALPFKGVAAVSVAALAAAEFFFRARMLWVATILGVCGFLIMQARNKAAGLSLAALACACLAGAYSLELYPAAVQARIAATIRPMESPDLVARVRVAEDVAGAVVASPVVGLGVGQSGDYLTGLPDPPDIVNAHNIILHAAAEGGIGAAVALLLLPFGILLLWRAGLHECSDSRDRTVVNWACASLLAMYVAAQLTPALYEHTFYFMLAVLASTGAREDHPQAA